MLINLNDTQSGEITLTDADGNELISFTPSREYNSVVISCADLEEGATYTLNTGETATEVSCQAWYTVTDRVRADSGRNAEWTEARPERTIRQ